MADQHGKNDAGEEENEVDNGPAKNLRDVSIYLYQIGEA